MTEYDHMPPIRQYMARWLCPGKVVITMDDIDYVLAWDVALKFATSLTEAFQLDKGPHAA